jgi:hypothetical protein
MVCEPSSIGQEPQCVCGKTLVAAAVVRAYLSCREFDYMRRLLHPAVCQQNNSLPHRCVSLR